MPLYTRKQLQYERSLGLEMTNKQNRDFYKEEEDSDHLETLDMTRAEFEEWMNDRGWSEENKAVHREKFGGRIVRYKDGTFEHTKLSWW